MGSDRNYRQFDQIQSFLTSASLFVGEQYSSRFFNQSSVFTDWAFLLPRKVGWSMKLMKDMGTQSYIWSGISTWLAWLGEQQNLMLLSLAIGIVTAIAGLIQRFDEWRRRKREDERAEELHQAKMARLRKGLSDE